MIGGEKKAEHLEEDKMSKSNQRNQESNHLNTIRTVVEEKLPEITFFSNSEQFFASAKGISKVSNS
jgi:hypothetical protein